MYVTLRQSTAKEKKMTLCESESSFCRAVVNNFKERGNCGRNGAFCIIYVSMYPV